MKLLVRERWPELSMMKAAAPQNRSPINRVGVAGARPGLEQRRFLSLYYGSLGWLRAAQALSCWAAGVIISAERRREELETAVRCQLGQGAVFSTGSARSALSSCLQAAGIGAGDEVLLSAYTCLAVPTAVIAAGATPVYADINAATLNVDADTWIAALSPRVRAVVVQHTLGKPASIEVVAAAARARGILVIEDCALSIGSSIDGRAVGTFGDAAIFSMELSKTLSCGWGGVLVVHQPELAGAMRERYAGLEEPGWLSTTRDVWQTAISAWCFQPRLFNAIGKYVLAAGFKSRLFRVSTPPGEFEGRTVAGFAAKMSGAVAALAAHQWNDLRRVAVTCEANARRLRQVFHELGIETPGEPDIGEVSVAPRVSFLVRDRAKAVVYFSDRGIELGQWFDGPLSPVPSSPLFNYQPGRYRTSEKIANAVVNLPCHSRLSSDDLSHIIATIREFVRDHPTLVQSIPLPIPPSCVNSPPDRFNER
jgi:dTDP-4-amino-4,6-dideoxygalactose transaminase